MHPDAGAAPAGSRPSRGVARLQTITTILAEEGRVEVADLAERLGVAAETIRRDLRTLESEHKLQRVHGGAVSLAPGPLDAMAVPSVPPEEQSVARLVWPQLPRSGAILLDTGRPATALAEAIVADPPTRPGLTIVTNSLDVAITLSRVSTLSVFTIGGAVRDNRAQEGDWALSELARLHTDVAVLCPAGVHPRTGLSQDSPSAAAVSSAQIAAAGTVHVMAGAETLGRSAFVHVAPIDVVDTLFVSARPAPTVVQAYTDQGVRVRCPDSARIDPAETRRRR